MRHQPRKHPRKKPVKRPKITDDSDDEDVPTLSTSPVPAKKARTQRGAATKKSYHFSDEDDDDEDYA